MYADDLLLLANSVTDLQKLVNICIEEFDLLDLSLNVSKSSCLRIGSRFNSKCANISTGGGSVAWCDKIRYLGIFISSGKHFKCVFDNARSSFYRSFNSIYSKIGNASSPNVILSLLSSYCLPSLLYGSEAIVIDSHEMQRLNLAYSRAFMKIFSSYDCNVIKQCQFFSGFLPLSPLTDLRRLKFLYKINACQEPIFYTFRSVIQREIQNILKFHCCKSTDNYHAVENRIWKNFEVSVFD